MRPLPCNQPLESSVRSGGDQCHPDPRRHRRLTLTTDMSIMSGSQGVDILRETLTRQAGDVPVPSCLNQCRNSELFHCKVSLKHTLFINLVPFIL